MNERETPAEEDKPKPRGERARKAARREKRKEAGSAPRGPSANPKIAQHERHHHEGKNDTVGKRMARKKGGQKPKY